MVAIGTLGWPHLSGGHVQGDNRHHIPASITHRTRYMHDSKGWHGVGMFTVLCMSVTRRIFTEHGVDVLEGHVWIGFGPFGRVRGTHRVGVVRFTSIYL